MKRNSWFLILACALLLCSLPAWAATQNAVVYGTVYDTAGNPMAGVTVTLDNPTFGFSRTTTTSSDGSYNFAEVPPADGYKVTAVLNGRTVDVRGGISVNVGDERVILPPLKEQAAAPAPTPAPGPAPAPAPAPAAAAAAEGPAIHPETISNSISGVITREQLLALPLYNRNFLALGYITPNVHDVQQGSPLGGASFSVAGNRPEANDFLLDGTDNVAASSNQAIPFQVNDSIQEFRVVSSGASAEYGRGQGGVVNVVTRRATNSWHGSGYGYFGDQVLNADSPLSVYNGTTFDQAAAHAGSMTPTALTQVLPGFPAAPTTYNNYVATAVAGLPPAGPFPAIPGGFCTDSIGAAGATVPCATGGFGRNTLFDPAAILHAHGSRVIPFSSQQFGFNIGGPVMKDKFFIFGSYEGTHIDNPNPIFERVPSTFDRTFDPLASRAGYPGYTFASTLGASDPNFLMAQRILGLYPTANVIGVPDALEFFRGEAPNHTWVNNLLFRADWMQSDKSSWTFRYVVQQLKQLHDDTLPVSANYPGNGSTRNALNQNLNISFSHTISSTLLNDLHAGFSRFHISETPQDHNLQASNFGFSGGQMPTIFLSGLDPQYSGANPTAMGATGGWYDQFWGLFVTPSPTMPTLDGLFPMARIGAPLNSPSTTGDTTGFVGDTLSWTHGKHSFKFGGEYRHLNDHYFDGSFSRGFLVSSDMGEFTSDAATCLFFANGCAGNAFQRPSFDYFSKQQTPYNSTFNHAGLAGFIQDTWRATRRVTINLGLRYEYFSVPTEENNRIWNFDPAANGLVQQNTLATVDPFGNPCASTLFPFYFNAAAPDSGISSFFQPWTCNSNGSSKVRNKDATNFAPRVGLAWDIFGTGKTVFRGGVGWYYDQEPTNQYADLMYNRPTVRTFGSTATPQFIYGQTFLPFSPFCATQCGFGNVTANPANAAFSFSDQAAASPFGMMAMDVAHSGTPFTRQANVTIEQQLGQHMMVEGGYIGTQGENLPVVFNGGFNNEWFCTSTLGTAPFNCDINANYPVMTMTHRASSTYNSVMVRLREQGWHGLSFNATYVWSQSEDNSSNGIFPLLPLTLQNSDQQILMDSIGNPAAFCYGPSPSLFAVILLAPINPTALTVCPPVPPSPVSVGSALTTTGQGLPIVSRYLIPQDPHNFLQNDWGNSDFHVPHRFVFDYAWDVPGKGAFRGNWLLSGIVIAQSGQPFTIFGGPAFGEIDQRANVLGPVTQNNSNPQDAISFTNLQVASRPCFIAAPAFNPMVTGQVPFAGVAGSPCIGNSKRNQFIGPNYINWNMAVQKGFQVFGEGHMLTFRAEFYNLTNRDNFFNPISQMTLDGIGASFAGGSTVSNINPQFGKIKSAHDPRQIQFAVRYTF